MKCQHLMVAIVALVAAPTQVASQQPFGDGPARRFGVAFHAGTLGLGVDGGFAAHSRVTLRVGVNVFPFDPTATISGIEYTVDLPTPQVTGMVDLFLASKFRITGGLLFAGSNLGASGDLVGSVTIGPTVYAQAGTLTGEIVTNDLSPYIGIGWGNIAASRFGLFLDLGVALQGQPEVDLVASGPIASVPGLQADLDAEARQFEEDLDLFKFYPVATLGISIGF